MNITYLVGNGLDLSFGLETAYKDFYNYQMELYKPENGVSNIIYDEIIKDENNNFVNWADFEWALGDITFENTEIIDTVEKREQFLQDFYQVTDDLIGYLQSVENKYFEDKEFPSRAIDFRETLSNLINNPDLPEDSRNYLKNYFKEYVGDDTVQILSFNYTSVLNQLYNKSEKRIPITYKSSSYHVDIKPPIHAHGTLDKNLIIGINDYSQISSFFSKEQASDFIKEDNLKECRDGMYNRNCEIINSSDLICIFGMSIGETDKLIWQTVAKHSLEKNVPIIIYSYNPELNKAVIPRLKKTFREIENDFISKADIADDAKEKLRKNIHIAVGKNEGLFNIISR